MSKVYEYDAIIIGTGQSGPSLAGRLAGTGMKVTIIERKLPGGTCVSKSAANPRAVSQWKKSTLVLTPPTIISTSLA